MAGYGYTNRSNYNTYQGMEQPTYGYGNSDHLCRPVIVDAEGRKKPIISYNRPNNSEGYVTKIERVVEHVHTPHVMGTEYKYSSPTVVEPVREYRVVYDTHRRPSSPVRERPERVEEFITKVQTEVSRPVRTGLLGSTRWRNTPNSTGHNGTPGYSEYNNFDNNDHWNKQSGNTNRDDKFDDYYRRNETPTGPKGWTTPPSHHELTALSRPTNNLGEERTALSRPTNNLGEAIELLKEAAMGSAVSAVPPQARYMLPSSIVTPKREAYNAETIDSKEAARRYGNFNLASRPFKTAETYSGTIDSSEAARRYNGSRV